MKTSTQSKRHIEAVVKVVGIAGLQAKWHVAAEDEVAVDDAIFVKLCAGNKQLCNLVWEKMMMPQSQKRTHMSHVGNSRWQRQLAKFIASNGALFSFLSICSCDVDKGPLRITLC